MRLQGLLPVLHVVFIDLGRIATNQAQVFHIGIAEGHRRVAFVIGRDAQPSFDLRSMVYRIRQESVEATSEAQSMGHQGTMIEGYRAVERRAGVPGFSMGEDHHGCVIEEAIFALLYQFVRMLNLGKGVTQIFCSFPTGD